MKRDNSLLNNKGFSLVECIMAIALFSVMVLLVFGIINIAMTNQRSNDKKLDDLKSQAAEMANEQIYAGARVNETNSYNMDFLDESGTPAGTITGDLFAYSPIAADADRRLDDSESSVLFKSDFDISSYFYDILTAADRYPLMATGGNVRTSVKLGDNDADNVIGFYDFQSETREPNQSDPTRKITRTTFKMIVSGKAGEKILLKFPAPAGTDDDGSVNIVSVEGNVIYRRLFNGTTDSGEQTMLYITSYPTSNLSAVPAEINPITITIDYVSGTGITPASLGAVSGSYIDGKDGYWVNSITACS